MQHVAKLPDDLANHPNPLEELAVRMGINEPQELEIITKPFESNWEKVLKILGRIK